VRNNIEAEEFLPFDKEFLVGFEIFFTVVYVEIQICSRLTPRHWATGCRR